MNTHPLNNIDTGKRFHSLFPPEYNSFLNELLDFLNDYEDSKSGVTLTWYAEDMKDYPVINNFDTGLSFMFYEDEYGILILSQLGSHVKNDIKHISKFVKKNSVTEDYSDVLKHTCDINNKLRTNHKYAWFEITDYYYKQEIMNEGSSGQNMLVATLLRYALNSLRSRDINKVDGFIM